MIIDFGKDSLVWFYRRVGGFVYVISVLVSLESSLSTAKQTNHKFPDEKAVFVVLRAMFTCLTVAMRYEPANAKYFQVSRLYENIKEVLYKMANCLDFAG